MSEAYKNWQMEKYGNIVPESDTYLDEETVIQDDERKFEEREELWLIEQES